MHPRSSSSLDEYSAQNWQSLTSWLAEELASNEATVTDSRASDATVRPTVVELLERGMYESNASPIDRPGTVMSIASAESSVLSSSYSRPSTPMLTDSLFYNPLNDPNLSDEYKDWFRANRIATFPRSFTPPPVTPSPYYPGRARIQPPPSRRPIPYPSSPPPLPIPELPRSTTPFEREELTRASTPPMLSPTLTACNSSPESEYENLLPHTPTSSVPPSPTTPNASSIPMPLSKKPSTSFASPITSFLRKRHIGHKHCKHPRTVIITGRNFDLLDEDVLRGWLERETCGKVDRITMITNEHKVYPEWHVAISDICKTSMVFNLHRDRRIEVEDIGLLTVFWPEHVDPVTTVVRTRKKSLPERLMRITTRT